MTYTHPFPSDQRRASKAVKRLIFATTIVSIFSIFITQLFSQASEYTNLQKLFSLSWNGFQNFFIWQPFTYMFVHSTANYTPIFFIFHLSFNMILLWFIGTSLVEDLGSKPFLRLYFSSGIIAGLTSLFFMWLTQNTQLIAGCTPSIFAILIVWSMLFPEFELLVFLAFPMKAKWLVLGYLSIDLLVNLSDANFVISFMNLSAILVAYLYATLAWNLQSPFSSIHSLDLWLNKIGAHFRKKRQESQAITKQIYQNIKIYDFKTGEAIAKDDEFVDIMLSKVSLYGEDSLTWKERRRLKKISQRKKEEQQT